MRADAASASPKAATSRGRAGATALRRDCQRAGSPLFASSRWTTRNSGHKNRSRCNVRVMRQLTTRQGWVVANRCRTAWKISRPGDRRGYPLSRPDPARRAGRHCQAARATQAGHGGPRSTGGCGEVERQLDPAEHVVAGSVQSAPHRRGCLPRTGPFGGAERGGYCRRSSSVIWRITSEPLSTCSRTSASFSARFASARSRAVLTRSPHRGSRTERSRLASRTSVSLASPCAEPGRLRALGSGGWPSISFLRRRGSRRLREIRCVGQENLTGGSATRASHRSTQTPADRRVLRNDGAVDSIQVAAIGYAGLHP